MKTTKKYLSEGEKIYKQPTWSREKWRTGTLQRWQDCSSTPEKAPGPWVVWRTVVK